MKESVCESNLRLRFAAVRAVTGVRIGCVHTLARCVSFRVMSLYQNASDNTSEFCVYSPICVYFETHISCF